MAVLTHDLLLGISHVIVKGTEYDASIGIRPL